ncbi:DUF4270 family protein [Chryseobacterium sp. FH1]|uniref:DUF4270 family protein n=1 Tax=Chryseobacterium sp. FH1 TaxID=1233951 RepID=UPI0004E46EAD|nr:DUF4270 family protein [Chryseobacterium sp. FH1]KFC19847.1 hypothetical protein IO90_11455 [Chryseobacterium sp. FH1]
MIKIKTLMKVIPFLIMGMVVLNSCEGELDDLGSQLVEGGASDGVDRMYGLVAYNINNNDTIQTDASRIDSVTVGAFNEQVFGGQKVSYITQLRLNAYDPDFGTNPVIDSVVLTLKPRYETATDSLTTTTNEDYVYPDGEVAAKKVVVTYPVRKYGKYKMGGQKTQLTVKVHEVNDFLGAATDKVISNKAISLGSEIGSQNFNGTVNSVLITKDTDATELVKREVSYRMKLDNAFFQSKIIAKKGDQVLKDAASFIRYFKGISISVAENDGYLFSMRPNDAAITIYYKNDVTTDGVVTRTNAEVALSLGSGNVHISKIAYDRAGSNYASAMSSVGMPNDVSGDQLIYAQGMGGAGFGLKIPASAIVELKNMYKNEKVGIVSAKIRVYNDADSWNNSYRKPSSLLVKEKDSTRFLPDMTELAGTGYSLIRTGNLSTKDAYYDIGITASLKKIIEDESYDVSKGKDFIINLGSYSVDASTGNLLGQDFNSRAYTPNRIVLKGTDQSKIGQILPKESKTAQLRLIYTKK